MKHRRKRLFVLAVLIAMTIQLLVIGLTSVNVNAAGSSSSDVECVVNPIYSFTTPPDASLHYPDTRITLGAFTVVELLIAKEETLRVTMTAGTLTTPVGDTLTYVTSFSSPGAFDAREVGNTYPVAIELDAEAFNQAASGTYTANLLFEVVSSPEEQTVWQKQTVLTVTKIQWDDNTFPPDWLIAAVVALVVIALILVLAKRKTKSIKQNHTEDTDTPATGE